jgi:3-mercaptopyruvate sulfurtransferase SseA
MDALVVDLDRSVAFRDGHIPGAVWGVRTRLHLLGKRLARARRVILTSPDGVQAARALEEVRALTSGDVGVLLGGTAAWREAGLPLERDRRNPEDADCVDFYLRPYDRNDGVEAAMQAYLSWEIDLVDEIVRDGTVRFGA